MAKTNILELPHLPRKNYLLNASALADLAMIQTHGQMTETAAIHLALRNLAEMLDRGLPVYYASTPEGPEPPTSAPSAASPKPPRVVENRAKRGGRPPAPRPSNTKRGKK